MALLDAEGNDELARALALSKQEASGQGGQDDLARALAMSAGDVGTSLGGAASGDDLEMALAMSVAAADQEWDMDIQRALQESQGFPNSSGGH